MNENEYQVVDDFIEKLLAFPEPKDVSHILLDSKWLSITQSAKDVAGILEKNIAGGNSALQKFYSFEE